MARRFDPPPATLSEALLLRNVDEIRPMLAMLSIPKPHPTRKADMVKAIDRYLSGAQLRQIWECLNGTQQLAVRETLHGLEGCFSAEQFRAKYGVLPAGYKQVRSRKSSPLRFFLYPAHRYASSPTIIPRDLAKRLLEFAPPPRKPRSPPWMNCPKPSSSGGAAMCPRARNPTTTR